MPPIPVPVEEAKELYDKLGSWKAVAEVLKRPNGQPYKWESIWRAVRWKDQGNAGRYVA